MSEDDDDYSVKNESTDEEIENEKNEIKKLGLENLSKSGFSFLTEKKEKKKDDERPAFRGFN